MNKLSKVLLISSAIVAVAGISVGVYFGISQKGPTLSEEQIKEKLADDAINFYNKIQTADSLHEWFILENDAFYVLTLVEGNRSYASKISTELNKKLGYNFTLAFSDLPDTLVHENLIEINMSDEIEYIESRSYYKSNSFSLYSTYSPNIKLTFDLEKEEINYSYYNFEFKTVEKLNKKYFYDQYINFGSCYQTTSYTFSLYYRDIKNISIDTVPEIKAIKKPNVKEILEIEDVKYEIYSDYSIISYKFTSENIGLYKFSITEKGSDSPFGYFHAQHDMMYCD